jgi:uncharacterized protein (DUF302 family)
MRRCIVWLTLFYLMATPALADDIFLTASRQSAYRSALDDLTVAITNHDYTLIKIQPVDQGLRHKGYQTSDYKLLFFGDRGQVNEVLKASPEASVLLPLKIMLYRNGDTVVASAPSMKMWKGVFGNTVNQIIDQWERDVQTILHEFASQSEWPAFLTRDLLRPSKALNLHGVLLPVSSTDSKYACVALQCVHRESSAP